MKKLLILLLLSSCAFAATNPGQSSILKADDYGTLQEAIAAAGNKGYLIVPSGTYNVAGPLVLKGIKLVCYGATLKFSSLKPDEDGITIEFSGDARTELDGCTLDLQGNGRDAIRVSGGNRWQIENVDIQNFARDAIHVEPSGPYSWSENFTIRQIQTWFHGMKPGPNVRDVLNFSIDQNEPSAYINEGVIESCNLRGYRQYAIHFYDNGSDPPNLIHGLSFKDCHTDSQGLINPNGKGDPGPAIYFERGPKGVSNGISDIIFIGGGAENTVRPYTSNTSVIFKASGPETLYGLSMTGFTNGGYRRFFDANLLSDAGNVVQTTAASNLINGAYPMQFWKDGTPTQAGAIGLAVPGSAVGNDLILSTLSHGMWAARLVVLANGSFSFRNASGVQVAAIDNNGKFTANKPKVKNSNAAAGCGGTAAQSTIVSGTVALIAGHPSSVTVSGFSPTFSSASSYSCTVTNATNPANNLLSVANRAANSFVITGPNAISDAINYICVGN